MRRAGVKILLGFLMVTLIAPTVFFARPKKAEALISLAQCIAARVTALATAVPAITSQAATAVMTISPAEAKIAAQTSAGQDWVQCFMKGLVKIIAKTLLHTFTQSIVNWINRGFEGSPSFVTNPEGFLADVADQTIGRVIEDISPFLCSPFRLNIRFALGFDASLRSREEVHCRLSDVITNVRGAYNGFVTGAAGSGNLSRWIHIAGTPQNNPYGAYVAASYDIGASITTAQGQQIKLLDWGKGFMSWRSCKRWGQDVRDGSGRVIRRGPCVEQGEIRTPGSIIQDQTSGALGTTFRELEVASEIDEIVGALINQLLVKAITGVGGLLGASSGNSTNGGVSATAALSTDPKQALAISDAVTPPGINCNLRYYPATIENPAGSGIYVPNNNDNTVYTDNLAASTNASRFTVADGASKDTGETWAAYFARVRAGCANQWNTLISNASTEGLGRIGGGGTGGQSAPPTSATPPPAQSMAANLAIGKVASQSSTRPKIGDWRFSSAEADRAINGSRDWTGGPLNVGGAIYGLAATLSGTGEWWQVDLTRSARTGANSAEWRIDEISRIRVTGPASVNEVADICKRSELEISVRDDNQQPLSLSARRDIVEPGLLEILYNMVFATPLTGARYVRITSSAPCTIVLAEVEVFGKQTNLNTNTPVTPPTAPFGFTTTAQELQLESPEPGTLFQRSLSFTPNQPINEIKFNAQLYECTAPDTTVPGNPVCREDNYSPSPTSFLTDSNLAFTSLNFTYWLEGKETVKNAIISSGAGYVYNADLAAGVTFDPTTSAVTFANNLSFGTSSPMAISITGSLRTKRPFRIKIDACRVSDSACAAPLGTANVDFSTQKKVYVAPPSGQTGNSTQPI